MMFNFAWFREQTCIIACPYGRLQSVLLDRQSMIVSYDAARGEPRTRATRLSLPIMERQGPVISVAGEAPSRTGDCVDCSMCVQVCPTGIDIRDGLQIECVGCAQCIDACDAVMAKVNRPLGLIRYSSESAMAGEPRRLVRPRVIVYSAVVTILTGLLGILLATRSPADVTLLRNVGRPFVVTADGAVDNTMKVKVTNRTDATHTYRIAAVDPRGEIRAVTNNATLTVAPGQSVTEPVQVIAPASRFVLGHLDATLRITGDDNLEIDRDCRLLGPATPTSPTGATHERR
jgi:cytochrome c oxidase accessory protein FixG